MASLIQYRHFFSTRIFHEYYLPRESALYNGLTEEQRNTIFHRQEKYYDISSDFDIVPTRECAELLKNFKLIFKQDNYGFFVACKVRKLDDEHFQPYIPFDESISLCFAIYLKDQYLVNFSNLRQEKDIKKKDRFVYYFSNRANNPVSPDTLYLSNPVSEFNEEQDYEAGEVYVDNTDPDNPEMYEAIKDNGPGAYESADWIRIFADPNPLPRFITSDDRIVLRPRIFNFDVKNAFLEKLTIIIKDCFGKQVKENLFETTQSGEPLTQCEVELRDLASAYYTLQVMDSDDHPVEGLTLTFYLSDELYIQKPFALVECFHIPDGSLNEYKLLDEINDNHLLSPTYTVHWKNRSTYWRYYYSGAPGFTSSHVDLYQPSPGDTINNILVSNQPFGLTKFNRRLGIKIDGEDLFLPNPDIHSIFPEKGKIYSEINMGGGLGPPPNN